MGLGRVEFLRRIGPISGRPLTSSINAISSGVTSSPSHSPCSVNACVPLSRLIFTYAPASPRGLARPTGRLIQGGTEAMAIHRRFDASLLHTGATQRPCHMLPWPPLPQRFHQGLGPLPHLRTSPAPACG